MVKRLEITGQRFGRLVALRYEGSTGAGSAQWRFACDCGAETVRPAKEVKYAGDTSCGCLRRELAAARCAARVRHGLTYTPTWNSWVHMLDRCENPNHMKYRLYGGRGIVVCQRWHKFEDFLADMGERPAGKTLDRWPNPDGNYEPSNCRWATPIEQRANRSTKKASA